MATDCDNFRKNLATLSRRRQGAVAEKAGVTREYVNKVIHGTHVPTLDIASRLSEAVGRRLDQMIQEEDAAGIRS